MIFERIGASHPLFEASFTLYEASFPPNERRTREDHLRALQDADFFPLGAGRNEEAGHRNRLNLHFPFVQYNSRQALLFCWMGCFGNILC